MPQTDPIIDQLMSPGAPFEVVERDSVRVFKNMAANMSDVLNASRRFGDVEFIVAGERRLSYKQFFEAADALAGDLVHKRNIGPGDPVAICMKNSPEWMIAFVAIINAGGVARN